jgi:hypothetical protein
MTFKIETKLKQQYGYLTIHKGCKLYHMLKDLSDTNELFYFHPSESNVGRLGYLYEERYEVTEDIELAVLFTVPKMCRMIHVYGYAGIFHKNKSSFKYGYIGATPTSEGINMGLRHPSPFLKKISDARKIKYGWIEDNESTYGYYIKTSKIILSMNSRFKNEFDDYIEYHKDSNWTNSLTQIIDNNPIEYFDFEVNDNEQRLKKYVRIETRLQKKYGIAKIHKGCRLYHILKDLSDTNELFYFHPSESNVEKTECLFEERYEVTEDIEIPIIFNIPEPEMSNTKYRYNYIDDFYNNKSLFTYGFIQNVETGYGLQLILKHPSSFLKKISDAQEIQYEMLNNDNAIYEMYANSSTILLSMNRRLQNQINEYITHNNECSNWKNSLTQIIDRNHIEYFDYEFPENWRYM